MARSEALLRISKTLLARRNELRKRLGMDLDELRAKSVSSGDPADAAFDSTGEELASRLVQLEAKELAQIELAITRIRQGKYGICAGCNTRILVARLNALPYSTLCIKCQREAENDSTWLESRIQADWANVRDGGEDREQDFDLSDIEADLRK